VCHWGGMLQMILEPPSNARLCGIGALHDVARNLRGGVCNTPVPYWEDKRKSPYRVGDL
jgi:hypothetical protein